MAEYEIEHKNFLGGLDKDSDLRYIESKNVRDSLNVRIGSTDTDSRGSVESVKGNSLIDNTLPSGHNKIVGAKEDEGLSSIFYFNYNSNGTHGIYEYNYKKEEVYKVVVDSLLGFNSTDFITGINVINGTILSWTSGTVEPCQVFIQRAKNTYDNLYTGTEVYPSPLTLDYLSAIKAYPITPIVPKFVSDGSTYINNVMKKIWQFRAQYVYADGQESAWGNISRIPVSFIDEIGSINFEPAVDNAIDVSVPTGSEYVAKINIAVRESTTGNFYLAKVVDKTIDGVASNSSHVYRFTNRDVLTPINNDDSGQLYDYIPKLAGTQEYIDSNRIVYGDITEDYDLPTLDVTTAVDFYIPPGSPGWVSSEVATQSQQTSPTNNGTSSNIQIQVATINGDAVRGTLSFRYNIEAPSAVSYLYQDSALINEEHLFPIGTTRLIVLTYFRDYVNNLNISKSITDSSGATFNISIVASISGDTLTISSTKKTSLTQDYFYNLQSSNVTYSGQTIIYDSPLVINKSGTLSIDDIGGVRGFKTKARHDLAFAYHGFGGRTTSAIISDELSVTVGQDSVPSVGRITVNISHNPPEWATHYSILYAGNSDVANFIQYKATTSPTGSTITGQKKIKLDFDIARDKNPDNNVTYSFTKGDRIRLVNSSGDTEVLSFDTSTNVLTYNSNSGIITIQQGTLVEVYSPKKNTEDKLYYEIGHTFPIVDGKHIGTISDQSFSPSSPASIYIDSGDVYFRKREYGSTTGSITDGPVEDFAISDYWESNGWSQGRPNAYLDTYSEKRRVASLRYTEPFVDGDNISYLNRVYDLSYQDYDASYGAIKKLHSKDKRLLSFQELKVGKILVNESVYTDLSGAQTIAISDTVLNDIIYFEQEFGIGSHPESFAIYGTRIYFSDDRNGVICRLSTDGSTPISKNYMDDYFTDALGNISEATTPTSVLGCYDTDFNEYVVSLGTEIESEKLSARNFGRYGIDRGEGENVIYTELSDDTLANVFVGQFITVVDDTGIQISAVIHNKEEGSQEVSILLLDGKVISNERNYTAFTFFYISQQTLAFNDDIKLWTSFYSYKPDYMVRRGLGMASFSQGDVYRHNSNQRHNNFYKVQYTSKVSVVGNASPNLMKFYKGIKLEGSSGWYMPNAYNDKGQQTNLIVSDFEDIEGDEWAAFLRDTNTPNVDNPLIDGDDMRDHIMVIELENDRTDLFKLFSVGINSVPSENTK